VVLNVHEFTTVYEENTLVGGVPQREMRPVPRRCLRYAVQRQGGVHVSSIRQYVCSPASQARKRTWCYAGTRSVAARV